MIVLISAQRKTVGFKRTIFNSYSKNRMDGRMGYVAPLKEVHTIHPDYKQYLIQNFCL